MINLEKSSPVASLFWPTSLREKIVDCEYGNLVESLLKNRIVTGIFYKQKICQSKSASQLAYSHNKWVGTNENCISTCSKTGKANPGTKVKK